VTEEAGAEDKGKEGIEPYAKFAELMERMNKSAVEHAVVCFSTHAAKDPKVAERFLARRAKEEWGTQEDKSGTQILVQVGLALEGSPD